MTGESLTVHKRAGAGQPPDTPLAERKNMVIGGTVVTGGRAKVVVTATGMQTEMGKIAGLVLRQGQSLPPGLQRLLGGEGEENLPRGLPGPARGRAQPQPVWNGHRFVSTLLPATTVTFSTTAAPRVPLSPILLHWHPL